MDLLKTLQALTRGKGIKPLEYHQTLREANLRRWGKANLIKKKGIAIDVVWQEFDLTYPGMFDSLDEFVEAIAERLNRKERLEDRYGEEAVGEVIKERDSVLVEIQTKKKPELVETKVLEEEDLVYRDKGKRKVKLTEKGIREILKLSI